MNTLLYIVLDIVCLIGIATGTSLMISPWPLDLDLNYKVKIAIVGLAVLILFSVIYFAVPLW